MIINKTALQASLVIGKDKSQPILANVHIRADGSTIACNGKGFLAVEAVDELKQEAVPFKGAGKPVTEAITIPLDFVNKIIKGIPADKQFDGLLELIHINQGTKEGELKVTTHDGKGEKLLKGQTYARQYVDFEGIAELLYFSKEVTSEVILDRKRLIATLQAMDKICGDTPTYVEVTEENNLLLRSFSASTEQRVVALVAGVKTEWEETCDFTKTLRKKRKKKVVRRRVKKKLKKKAKLK